MQGKIIKGIAGFYYIYAEDGNVYECKAKGIFRKDNFKPLVGDNVEITVLNEEEKEGSVTSILPRRNSLIRPAVANVDQAFLIFAMENPKPNFLLLDRFLIMMKQQEIPAVICFNKKDVGEKEEMEKLYEIYTGCGYRVVLSSTYEGEGMDEIHEILKGKTTVVAGPSGVGKSSITNCMQGEVQMETGEISKKLKRGKHTTRHSQVIPVEKNTFLVDTPGFSSLYLTDMKEEELRDYFPEFVMYEPQCRFQGCMHIHEPGCAVKKALSEGKISQQRYDNYLALYEELKRKGDTKTMYQLCPSILSADFNRLGEQIKILENEGVEWLHIDVMDGDFVPSISFGMPVIKSIRKESKMFFDVHLMVTEPERYIQDFVNCGADSITVHAEACEDLERTIERIKDAGVKVGVSIKPATPVNDISHMLEDVDMVLVMTVQPGFGGQKYMDECTEKIQELRELIDKENLNVDIEVDGGINEGTIETVMKAGANIFVAGSWVFGGDIAQNVRHIQKQIEEIGDRIE